MTSDVTFVMASYLLGFTDPYLLGFTDPYLLGFTDLRLLGFTDLRLLGFTDLRLLYTKAACMHRCINLSRDALPSCFLPNYS